MKKNGILCILIAAALLVTSLAAVSADQSSTINQQCQQDNNNAISGTVPNIAINSSNNQTINSMNIQAQAALTVQTGDIVAAGGDIEGSNITKRGGGVGNQTSGISQLAVQSNNNSIDASPADRGTITIDVINGSYRYMPSFGLNNPSDGFGGFVEVEELHINVSLPNVAVDSSNDQTINSINVQEQFAVAVQTGDTVAAVGDIVDSNIYKGPNSGPTPTPTPTPPGPPTPPTPPAGAGPAARP